MSSCLLLRHELMRQAGSVFSASGRTMLALICTSSRLDHAQACGVFALVHPMVVALACIAEVLAALPCCSGLHTSTRH